MVREIAWTPRWMPELQREAMLIERLFYPEKWIFQRHQLIGLRSASGRDRQYGQCRCGHVYRARRRRECLQSQRLPMTRRIAFASGHQQSFGLEAAGVLAAAIAAAFVPGTTLDAVIDEALAVAKDGTRAAIADIVDAARILKHARALQDRGRRVPQDHRALFAEWATTSITPLGKAGIASTPISRRGSTRSRDCRWRSVLPSSTTAISTRPFEDGINSGRDTDSIGVMAGAILGALHGESVIDAATGRSSTGSTALNFTSADAFHRNGRVAIQTDEHELMPPRSGARNGLTGLVDRTQWFACQMDRTMLNTTEIFERIYSASSARPSAGGSAPAGRTD